MAEMQGLWETLTCLEVERILQGLSAMAEMQGLWQTLSVIACVQVIKLSDAVQHLPRERTLFVHGVPPCFLSVGDKMAAAAKQVIPSFPAHCRAAKFEYLRLP